MIIKFLPENLKVRYVLGELGVYLSGRIQIPLKWDTNVWIGFM
jgi:hypothetical protein